MRIHITASARDRMIRRIFIFNFRLLLSINLAYGETPYIFRCRPIVHRPTLGILQRRLPFSLSLSRLLYNGQIRFVFSGIIRFPRWSGAAPDQTPPHYIKTVSSFFQRRFFYIYLFPKRPSPLATLYLTFLLNPAGSSDPGPRP